MGAMKNKELRAMSKVGSELEGLDTAARKRVIQYVLDKYIVNPGQMNNAKPEVDPNQTDFTKEG